MNHVAKFTCEIEMAPNVRFQWYRAGREIYDGDKYTIRTANYTSTLEIPRPQVVDCGEYSCKASNQYGSVSSTATLKVTGKYKCISEYSSAAVHYVSTFLVLSVGPLSHKPVNSILFIVLI